MIFRKFLLKLLFLLLSFQNVYAEKIKVWHGLGGELGKHFQTIVDSFNQSLKEKGSSYEIEIILKGTYDDVVKAFLDATAEERPDIVQVYEMATRLMLDTKSKDGHSVYLPVQEVMQHSGTWLHEKNFLPQILLFYRAGGMQLPSVPFNASTVVLYCNKTALDNARLKPMTTFEEFTQQMKCLKEAGEPTSMGAGWLSGHHMDQIGARHNKQIATHGNGVDRDNARLSFDRFFTFHLKKLQRWYKNGWFSLEQGPKAEQAFADRKIVYLSQGGNRHSDIIKAVGGKFEIGVAAFPYWAAIGKPFNTIAGGGSFWVANKPHNCERVSIIAQFLSYLVSPEVQALWQRLSGYVPVIKKAHDINLRQGFFDSSELGVQATKIAYESFTTSDPGEFSRGILLPKFPDIRKIEIDQMEKAIRGDISAEDALHTIQTEGNELLSQTN